MFKDIYHVAYLTDSIEAAKTFYEQIFGGNLTLVHENTAGGMTMAYLQVGNTWVELLEPADKSKLNGRTGLILDHVGYVVDDIEAEVERLKAKGITFATAEPATNAEGARLIYMNADDTLGTRIHLTERPKG